MFIKTKILSQRAKL